ncbi:MAG: HEAT repeat domain-containing protein, partial [Planctomycetaceae bacterium]
NAKPAVDTLVAALADADPAVRGDAAVAVASIGADAAEAVPALVSIVEGKETEDPSRYAAIFALGKIGRGAAPAAAALKALVGQEADPLSQIVAAWAMLQIEPDNKEQIPTAVPLLRKALRSERKVVRLEAILALADLGADASSAVAMLELMAEDDPLPSIRKAAAAAAAKIKAAR